MRTKSLLAGIIRAAIPIAIALVAVSAIASAGAPVISNVTSSFVTSNSATITWDTDVLSDSQVTYGKTSGYYLYTEYNATDVTSHSISLTGLFANTTYYYVVNSTIVGGNSAESAECNFTTEIPATIVIKPETLNLKSKGAFVAFIILPEGYDVADIDVSTVECEGAEAVKGVVSGNKYIAKFKRHDLVNVSKGKGVELTVTGELYDGTPFAGSDTIRVK